MSIIRCCGQGTLADVFYIDIVMRIGGSLKPCDLLLLSLIYFYMFPITKDALIQHTSITDLQKIKGMHEMKSKSLHFRIFDAVSSESFLEFKNDIYVLKFELKMINHLFLRKN